MDTVFPPMLRCWRFFSVLLALLAALSPDVRAQGVGPGGRFPPTERVVAEHSDPAELWATLKVLTEEVQRSAPNGSMTPLFAEYYNAMNDVDFRLRQEGTAAGYDAFSLRVRELLAEERFRGRVLERYSLGGARTASDEPEDEMDVALRRSVPYWIAALIVIGIASPTLVYFLDRHRLRGSPRQGSVTPPTLPESLRTVSVLGRSYDVEEFTGQVIDKESHTEQQTHVTTTGGGTTIVGDQVFVSPTQVHVSNTVTRKDALWMRDAAGNESAWNFTNAALQARAGHMLSAIAWRDASGHAQFLLAYNHTTGQLDSFDGLNLAHRPRRLAAWIGTTFVGGGAVLYALLGFVDGVQTTLPALFIPSNWPAPLAVAAVVALLTVAISAALLQKFRTQSFHRRYTPAFRRHFEHSSAKR